jgi:hypothetical protein
LSKKLTTFDSAKRSAMAPVDSPVIADILATAFAPSPRIDWATGIYRRTSKFNLNKIFFSEDIQG